ncbi:MAG: hypothetical protein ABEJ74_05245 [Haloferacaceae archaeon]
MGGPPGRVALGRALASPRRHLGALAVVVAAYGAAALLGTEIGYYVAALVTFTVWMAWFVLTAVALFRHVEF